MVFVEGAGSASEINLRAADIANFGFARALDLPVMLVGDIHRGGVIASIVGTLEVIQPKDRALVVGSLINRFHGDPSLFGEGKSFIETKTGQPCWGPLPEFPEAKLLPPEDVLALDQKQEVRTQGLKIVVPRLPRIANFDDLDPLRQEEGVSLNIIEAGEPLPIDADLVILPGSNLPFQTTSSLCHRGGTSTSKHSIAKARRCLEFVVAIKCWVTKLQTQKELKVLRKQFEALDC